jgi:MFS family permease
LVRLRHELGSLVLGVVVDRAGIRNASGKFLAVAVLSLLSMITLMLAFGGKHLGIQLTPAGQFGIIGGFLVTCTVGPAAAIVLDVIHPGVRSTCASVLSLFQNLFGLAIGPFIGGVLSHAVELENALALTPLACIIAAASFVMASGGYQNDRQRIEAPAAAAASQGAFA